jgi:hypothetical protein
MTETANKVLCIGSYQVGGDWIKSHKKAALKLGLEVVETNAGETWIADGKVFMTPSDEVRTVEPGYVHIEFWGPAEMQEVFRNLTEKYHYDDHVKPAEDAIRMAAREQPTFTLAFER